MRGILGIYKHRISCVIGVYPEERERKQVLWIDLEIRLDFSERNLYGGVEETVDYERMAELCTELAGSNRYLLLEALAVDIVKQCVDRFHALWAWVRIRKPSAIASAAYAYVEFECTAKERNCS